MMLLSIDKVLEKTGGPGKLRATLQAAGQPKPAYWTIAKWQERGVIPGWWAGPILYAMAQTGVHPLHLLTDTHATVIKPEMADPHEDDDLLELDEAELDAIAAELGISDYDTTETNGSAS